MKIESILEIMEYRLTLNKEEYDTIVASIGGIIMDRYEDVSRGRGLKPLSWTRMTDFYEDLLEGRKEERK